MKNFTEWLKVRLEAVCPECRHHFRTPEGEEQDHSCPKCGYYPAECPNCNSRISDDTEFCPRCKANLGGPGNTNELPEPDDFNPRRF